MIEAFTDDEKGRLDLYDDVNLYVIVMSSSACDGWSLLLLA